MNLDKTTDKKCYIYYKLKIEREKKGKLVDVCFIIEVPVSKPKELCLNKAPNSLLCNTNIQVIKTQGVIAPQTRRGDPKGLYSKEEVNARIKEATDNLRQEFIKSTEEP
ncbi:hypothetical protein C2G38_2202385 [Gigaspora rosea]|uniref:Uncharacterized protein n=1 Tax=Gigaspora rosea TaxID=44941 RepID=A0A397USR8_9GLOM|nr:hypothetical protein C2G38_2202385 [Gigaspora rosea]